MRSKNNKNITKNRFILLIVVVLILLLGVWFVFRNKPIYKIESRTKEYQEAKKTMDHDVQAWIRVQGTNIDYPIIYYDGKFDLATVTGDFAWTNTKIDKKDNRVAISGHNILNVSKKPLVGEKTHTRFEQLMAFVYPSFVEENKYIEYTVNGENYLYAIYAVLFEDYNKTDDYDFTYSKKQLGEYIEEAKTNSYFEFDIDVSDEDHLLTLITCTRMFGSNENMAFKVEARRLRKGEKAANYKVSEKDNYKELKEIMEGDENDEEV